MKKFFLLLACAVLTILPPAAAQRRPFRPCPQRPHVNELREKTRSKMIASRARTKAGAPTPRYGLIILAAFKNQAFTKDKAYFENLINGSASTSALSYFNEQWNGFYDFHFDITDIVTVSQDYSYYGKEVHNEDAAPEQMIMEACQLVDDKVDFSKYAEPLEVTRIRAVWHSLPAQLSKENRKFIAPRKSSMASMRPSEPSAMNIPILSAFRTCMIRIMRITGMRKASGRKST